MTEPFEGQTYATTLIPHYQVTLQWHKFEDGQSRGYRVESYLFPRKEAALTFIRRHRRYLASMKRACAWAERQGTEGYLTGIFPLKLVWQPREVPEPIAIPLPEEMVNWKTPQWLLDEED